MAYLRNHAIDWRVIEPALVDILRRRGCCLDYGAGVTRLIAEFHDEDSGALLRRQCIVCLEDVARDLADALADLFGELPEE
jgi:hypothetical protein